MRDGDPDGHASGFICPTCGGALWEQQADGPSTAARGPVFECRIGHRFEAAALWIEHSAARNRAVVFATRSLAEHAALARKLIAWALDRGDSQLAETLEAEAVDEDRRYEQVRAMIDDIPGYSAR